MKGSLQKKKSFGAQANYRKEVNTVLRKVCPCLFIPIKSMENNDNKQFNMFYSISFFSMLFNSMQILSTPVCLKTNKMTGFLGGRQGKEETELLKYCKKGHQETKSTCCRQTTDFQEKYNSCTTVAREESFNVALPRAKDLACGLRDHSFSGFYPNLFLSCHAQTKMCSPSFLSKYAGTFLI